MAIGNFAQQTEVGFENTRLPTRGIPYDNTFQNIVTYEVSTTHRQYYRSVYSILDFLSEMGGLFSAFGSLCLLVISSLNFNGSYQYLMRDNFYSRREIGKMGPFAVGATVKVDGRNDTQWSSFKTMMLNMRTFLP